MTSLLFLDTETGGLDPDRASLLTAGVVAYRDGRIYPGLEVWFKSDYYTVSARALEINGLTIVGFHELAQEPEMAIRLLLHYKREYLGDEPVRLAGHNVQFDMAFLRRAFDRSQVPWSDHFHHLAVDTASLSVLLMEVGLIPELGGSLDELCQHFEIYRTRPHRALSDALDAARLYAAMSARLRERLEQ